MSSGKQLVRGKSGMRMIAISANERSPFLLEEPHWTDDAQVSCFVAFIPLLLDNFISLFVILELKLALSLTTLRIRTRQYQVRTD